MASKGRSGSPIRVFIVADVRLYREGLASTLRTFPCLAIVGTAASRVNAMLTIPDLLPDVVVIDTAIAGALDLIRDLRVRMPATRLLAFAVDEHIASAGEDGARPSNDAAASMSNGIIPTTLSLLL